MAVNTAKGTVWKNGDGTSPEVFTAIGQLRAYSQSGPTATVQDVSNHDTGNWGEQLATILNPGTVSGPVNYDKADATHAFATGVWNDLVNLTLRNIQIIFAGSQGQLDMGGYYSGHSFDFPPDNVLQANIEFAVSGEISTTQA